MSISLHEIEQELRNYFLYDPDSGVLMRFSKQNKKLPLRKPNKTRSGKEYISFTFTKGRKNKRTMYAHTLIHFIVTGKWVPEGMCIDHIDGDGTNNRWENLRVVSLSANQLNRHKTPSLSGYVGVHRETRCNKWFGKVTVNKKQMYTTLCDTPEEASRLRKQILEKLNG